MARGATSEAETGPLRLQFDRTIKLAFCGSSIGSDGGLLLHRELDDALALTDMAAALIGDPRTGKNGRHRLAGFLRQSVFSRLAGYEDVNDADRLCLDPVMRQLVGGRAVKNGAASASAMGRFETEMLTQPENLLALIDLPGRWIDAVHDRRPPKVITLDMDSSVSPVHGDQDGAMWNGHFQSKCLHPLFAFK
jgi:Transposase DDE domain group 1